MNDRFRFRAWDKKNKRMLYNIQDAYDDGGVEDEKGNEVVDCSADCFSYFFPYDNDKNEGFIVEQCTGLKDKNGRLIYEGDIVFYGGVELWWVVFEEKYCSFELLRKDGNGLSMSAHKEMTVVGNIHENPELLEEQK